MAGRTYPDATPTLRQSVAPAGPEVTSRFRPDPPDDTPKHLGPYELRARLGAGGMGVVWRAHDTALDRPVALKLLRADLVHCPQGRARFLREARAAAAVKSDHVVTTYQVGEQDGVPYMAMELLAGASLDDTLEARHAFTIADVARIGREAALGLAAAHDRGLVHRDIKPSNLWIETPGGRVKVLDFGLALPTADAERLTSTGVVLGTPAYMAPEQARDDLVDHRADLFSLGSVLYRVLAGRLPFPGANTLAVLTSLAVDTPTPLRTLVPGLPPAFADLIDQLLAKKPADRPPSALEVAKRLAAVEAELVAPPPVAPPAPVIVPPPSSDWRTQVAPPPEPEAPPPRRPWLAAVALVAAMLAATGVVVRLVDPEGKALADLAAQVRGRPGDRLDPFVSGRSYWQRLDGRGRFEKVGRVRWLEYDSARPGGPFDLTETDVTPEYIVLFDPGKRLALRLSTDRVEAKDANDQWQPLLYGRWDANARPAVPPKLNPPG